MEVYLNTACEISIIRVPTYQLSTFFLLSLCTYILYRSNLFVRYSRHCDYF